MTIIETMEKLRAEGWCVVLKCLPLNLPWIIEGSRSEYDAPCDDKKVGRGKWCCELSWMGSGKYRIPIDSLAETPKKAVENAFIRSRPFTKNKTKPPCQPPTNAATKP